MESGGGKRRWAQPIERAVTVDRSSAPAFSSIDTFMESMTGVDPAGPPARRRATIADLYPGEASMAFEIVKLALELAAGTSDDRHRREARAWLVGRFECIYTARVCIEALGGDFEVVRERLLEQWAMQDAIDRTLTRTWVERAV